MLHKDVGGRVILDHTPISFIKSESHSEHFVPLCNKKIFFIRSSSSYTEFCHLQLT